MLVINNYTLTCFYFLGFENQLALRRNDEQSLPYRRHRQGQGNKDRARQLGMPKRFLLDI